MALTEAQKRNAEKNRRYWRDREEEALKHYITEEAEYDREIKRIYQNMLDACQKEIDSFYAKYAGAEGITIAEAKKRVSKLDIAAYERKAAKYVKDKDFSKKANEEMRLYNATMKINRLEMLKANIGLETIAGHEELEKFMAGILKGRTMDEMERQAGILGKTIRNNAAKANAIVNGSFHNGTFSDRIWQYQDLMRQDLGKLLQQGLIQGKGARAIAKDLKKYWYGNDPRTGGGATYCMERLMRTELARVQTEAQKQSFIRNGFTHYEFIVNGGCCAICQGLSGKHFRVDKMMPGDNAPPLHPHCRCSTAAWEDDAEYEAWLDYLEKGGTTEEWNARKKTLENSADSLYSIFQKLSDAGGADPEIAKVMEEAVSKMPKRHREIAESMISSIEITDSEKGSFYRKSTKQLFIARKADQQMVLHEFAHALECALDSYNDPSFRKIMFKGLENVKPSDIYLDDTNFKEEFFVVKSDKFVSVYQGRLYDEYGIFFGGDNLSLEGMRDYLAEGYAEYILNPDNLKKHDPDLFGYFEGIV